jgi:hypothetical protein
VGRLKFPNHFIVDAGDFFGAGGEQDSLKSAFMLQSMDKLGYDVVTLGEREFNFGQKFLLDGLQKTKIEAVCANLVYGDDKKPFVKPYVIRRVGNVRVAFFGLMGKDLKIRQLSSERPLTILDPFATARGLLPELRKKADVIVLLSHLGMTDGQRLTLEAPGFDVMVFGHQVGVAREVLKTNGVINVRGGERGQHIPLIHLVLEDRKITSFDGDVTMLDAKVPADDAMNIAVDAFQDELNRRLTQTDQENAQTQAKASTAALTGDHYLGESNCRRCHEAEYQTLLAHPHARAFSTLTKNQRDESPECVRCHVLAYGQSGGFVSKASTPELENVQCESCHGMGTKHDAMVAGQATVGPEVCQTCHVPERSPNFNYDEYLKKIVHWK